MTIADTTTRSTAIAISTSTANVDGAAKENSPNIVTSEKGMKTTTITTTATIVATTSSLIQTTTAGVLSFFKVRW